MIRLERQNRQMKMKEWLVTQAGINKHDMGFWKRWMKVHELTPKKLMVLKRSLMTLLCVSYHYMTRMHMGQRHLALMCI